MNKPQRKHLVGDIVAALWVYTITLAIASVVFVFFFGGCISGLIR